MAYYPRRYFPGYGGETAPGYVPVQPDTLPYGSDYLTPRQPVYPTYAPDNLPLAQQAQPLNPTQLPTSNSSDTIRATVVQKKNPQNPEFIVNKRYRYYGIILCLLSLASMGVEIGNVVFTYAVLCKSSPSSYAAQVPYILTWIAPGIWGSIPVFLAGVFAYRVAGTYKKEIRPFAFFSTVSALIFTPVMIGISIAEIITYSSKYCGQSTNSNGYDFSNPGTLVSPKFILPLVVAVLGGIEFYMTIMITAIFCCCRKPGVGKINTALPTDASAASKVQPTLASDATMYPSDASMVPQRVLVAQPPPAPDAMMYPSAGPIVPQRAPVYYSPYSYGSGPVYRPATSRGFAVQPAYGGGYPGAVSTFYGSNPTMASMMVPGPNPAYRI